VFHFDGEFRNLVDLIEGTLTGRNFGWLPDEHDAAVQHIATIIREDDGSGLLARSAGGAYRDVFLGGPKMPDEVRLPFRFRMDVRTAGDAAILRRVAQLIAAYVNSLQFVHEGRAFDGSPFDIFLEKNGIPRAPKPVQSHPAYTSEVRSRLDGIPNPVAVEADRAHVFALHDQPFQFGAEEIRGLRIFMREGTADGSATSGVGNCATCHPLPTFSDLKLHNTGVSQREYDDVHGAGAFAAMSIPDLATRAASPEAYLPGSPEHPAYLGPFRQPADAARPEFADLGVWNCFANPDLTRPHLQNRLRKMICESQGPATCRAIRRDQSRLLDASIALFKTPSLRDLGDSQPYFHDGSRDTLEDVVSFYREVSEQARAGTLRNASPEIAGIHLGPDDVAPLAAFLRALNEDYE
jgi:cytochrome c peroxidase